jgi:hypothetical protein
MEKVRLANDQVDILSNFRLPLHHLSKRNAWIIEPLNIQK